MSAWHSVHRHWQPQGPTSRLLCVNISSFCVRPYCYRRLRPPRMMAVRGVCRPDALSVRTRPTGISCPPRLLRFEILRTASAATSSPAFRTFISPYQSYRMSYRHRLCMSQRRNCRISPAPNPICCGDSGGRAGFLTKPYNSEKVQML